MPLNDCPHRIELSPARASNRIVTSCKTPLDGGVLAHAATANIAASIVINLGFMM